MMLRDRASNLILFCLSKKKSFLKIFFFFFSVTFSVLVDYLTAKGITPTDCFKGCVDRLDKGEFKFTGVSMTPNITSQNHTCNGCATALFSELAFDYLKAVPKKDLPGWRHLPIFSETVFFTWAHSFFFLSFPGNAATRPYCYYGKNCRTQAHNVQHRQRYNHVCDQTKF